MTSHKKKTNNSADKNAPVFKGKPDHNYIQSCISVQKLAEITGIPTWRISYLRRRGIIPFVKLSQRKYVYPPYALDDYLKTEVYDEYYLEDYPVNENKLEEIHEASGEERFEL